ncbi:hypothetical protein [Nocardia salmonicida]|uniref:hypothetical protein n=1 Tax=Nocardia salmonicida TaxID=53431 RepID=UPI003F4D63CB
MVYCDWCSVPTEICDYLIELPTCPATLSWDWVEEFDEDDWDPEEIDSFLWPVAARCHELDTEVHPRPGSAISSRSAKDR